ncbi:sugar phosphate nucleotidyltransferase [Candidatus Bathyarchaeota archaeon]|nr:sugar phosphate nucleotidyltransferase [Candidatus Bathyarchaeota archaeon]
MVSEEVDSKVRRVVIPAAGLGTRLLPATKEMPKEMLPVFALDMRSNVCVKPLLQVIFEQLYDVGFREFSFIVGREKESISNHFTSDLGFLKSLSEKGKDGLAEELLSFYKKVNSSSLVFISQPEPRGFGDAVLRAKPYVKEQFMVQAGDTLILSKGNKHLRRLLKVHEELGSAATFVVKEVEDPKPFGIIEGEEMESGVYDVERVVEKPEEPPTNLAITALYLFSPEIFEALKVTPIGVGGEVQLTDGIQILIDSGLKVTAVKLDDSEVWLDIGSPEAYWDVLTHSYDFSQQQRALTSKNKQEMNL